ncbi:hypothetical protein PHIM7_64 [Sinorhizobium phage phiM7]|uniref:Uncharacterized protein n=3 Tax=Emdodecavirus TaxID=1980937 RepID=S5MV27_9CAUD|nr:hypothetical protein AB690_gp070 [Sinorhizobium phage phiM12]YP_009212320.1 hypothetical protein AVT40_gp080 [Sinorhizobium phage phiN3]YP_009601189.1 hypothetical protein FDH46_gp064 [Sinorhizobium phage phiM7]AKF12972.1 hypothetical protein PHIM19_65 [Sinorhizobium phage phiM19]AGR47717.1 hypothetical protein SmphiM12_085 [Sinorhizobium phage phiM12]AKF12612.1 hypothetical protein PHIM7_64 [Sinorhizobium phage phiM7]AKF13344.1 hypothetical protein PHIN3_80 [Sinorhizobium phage phiN3]
MISIAGMTNELIAFMIQDADLYASEIEEQERRVRQLKETLAQETENLAKRKDILRIAKSCRMVDGVAVSGFGFYDMETVVPNEDGSYFTADIYEKAFDRGFYAVTINEVNNSWSSRWRWNGGNVIGLGAQWTEEEATDAALAWLTKQEIRDC